MAVDQMFAFERTHFAEGTAVVKREFIVERQGRSFVLYAGLLDMAHSQGLRAIRTTLLQVPSEENGQTAIVHAQVETDRGKFSGIGDASPANVARGMLTCIIRLAETRAKARALRDAVNVGVTAFEELGEADELPAPTAPPPPTEIREHRAEARVAYAAEEAVPTQRTVTAGAGLVTPAQLRAIYSIGRDQHNLSESEINERSAALFGVAPHELSRKQASEFITSLKGGR